MSRMMALTSLFTFIMILNCVIGFLVICRHMAFTRGWNYFSKNSVRENGDHKTMNCHLVSWSLAEFMSDDFLMFISFHTVHFPLKNISSSSTRVSKIKLHFCKSTIWSIKIKNYLFRYTKKKSRKIKNSKFFSPAHT